MNISKLKRDPDTGQIMKGTEQIWNHEELVNMGQKGIATRIKTEPDFRDKSRKAMLSLLPRMGEWKAKRIQGLRDSLLIKIHLAKIRKIALPIAWEACKNDPRFQKGLFNQSRKGYSLISPDLDHYEGENLMHFVREHKDLFNPEDVTEPLWKSRAYGGLRQMVRPSPSFKSRIWKGWVNADPKY